MANADDQTISAISVAQSKVIDTFKSGARHANRVKFTLDGKHALVSDIASDDVVIFDVATRKQIKSIKVGRGPGGILMQPGGTKAYVALSGDNAVAVIDLATLEVIDHIPTGAGPDGMAWAAK